MQHCCLIAWVVRDYGRRRLVDSIGTLKPALRRLSDEQVVCGGPVLPHQRVVLSMQRLLLVLLRSARFCVGTVPLSLSVFALEVFAVVLVREAVRMTLGMLHFVVEASFRSVIQIIEPSILISLDSSLKSEPGIRWLYLWFL
jgi:hypothetical protein